MVKMINEEKGKVVVAGWIKSVNYGQTQAGNEKVTVCVQDGEDKIYVNFVNTSSAEYGESPSADNAKTFLESKYFEKSGYLGRPVAIRATVSHSTGEDGTEYTNYFGSRLYNPKSSFVYRVPQKTLYFGLAVVKEKDGKYRASLPANIRGKNGNWGQQWISGTLTPEAANDLAKVDGKWSYGVAEIVDGAFLFDKISSNNIEDFVAAGDVTDEDIPISADELDEALEAELEFD